MGSYASIPVFKIGDVVCMNVGRQPVIKAGVVLSVRNHVYYGSIKRVTVRWTDKKTTEVVSNNLQFFEPYLAGLEEQYYRVRDCKDQLKSIISGEIG